MEKHTLYDLLEYTRRVVALNFPETMWVSCEISQIKNSRGNLYLELIEKDEDSGDLKAQSSAAIWYKSHLFIKRKLGELAPSILEAGRKVLFRVRVDFNEVYGLKLIIEDVDPSYTIGVMEMERQKTIKKLQEANLLENNASLVLPPVIQKIAVISSEQAAGYKDFEKQLRGNDYAYDYDMTLYHVAVQGRKMEYEIMDAFRMIHEAEEDYDCIVMIRGGGSKLDLSGFDSYNICVAIAKSQIPVWTGIGHDVDDTIADIVAHTSYKTPTAVATAIVDHNLSYEMALNELYSYVKQATQRVVYDNEKGLAHIQQRLQSSIGNIIVSRERDVDSISDKIETLISHNIDRKSGELEYTLKYLSSLDPERILAKGFAYIKRQDADVSEVRLGDTIEVVTYSDLIEAEVKNIQSK